MEEHYRLTMDSLPQFLLGGSAEFILSEKETKAHIDFRIKRDSKNPHMYWVRYKAVEWVYIGYIHAPSTLSVSFHLLKLDVTTANETIIKADVFRKFILFVYYGKRIPSNLEVLYTGRCSICNRVLKDPVYIRIGIGKICLENAAARE